MSPLPPLPRYEIRITDTYTGEVLLTIHTPEWQHDTLPWGDDQTEHRITNRPTVQPEDQGAKR